MRKPEKEKAAKGNAMKVGLKDGQCLLVPMNTFQSFFNANKSIIVGYTRGHQC